MIKSYSQPTQFRLLQFSRDFMFNIKTGKVVRNYKKDLEYIPPLDAMKALTWMVESDYNIQTVSNKIDKITNVFYKPLLKESKPYPPGHFLIPYISENLLMLNKLKETRPLLKAIFKSHNPELLAEYEKFISTLKSHSRHFLSLEIHIFTLFERVLPQYAAYVHFENLFHDEFKQMLREIEYELSNESLNFKMFNKLVGMLYFRLSLRLYRENLILFPVCCQYIHERFYKLVLVKEPY
jgi:DUF438 domain-containing protein